jgi:hypothetical protein
MDIDEIEVDLDALRSKERGKAHSAHSFITWGQGMHLACRFQTYSTKSLCGAAAASSKLPPGTLAHLQSLDTRSLTIRILRCLEAV